MKTMKMLCLVVATMSMFSGAASASQFTSPAGTVYTSPVSAGPTEEHVYFETDIGPTNVYLECIATLEFQIDKHGSSTTAGGLVRIMRFECGNEDKFTVLSRGSLEFHALGNGNATVTSSGLEVTYENLPWAHCKYQTKNSHFGTLTGSKNTGGAAVIDMKGAVLTQVGFPQLYCGPTFEATSGGFVVQKPTYLDVS